MKRSIISFLLFFSGAQSFAQINMQYFDPSLKGKYNIGFRRSYESNYTRLYTDSCGTTKTGGARPVIVNVWYPTLAEKKKTISIKDLITIKTGKPYLERFDSVFSQSQYKLAMLYTYADRNGDKYDSSISRWKPLVKEKFNKYYHLSTSAQLNIPMAPGKFPVVVYHPGLGGTIDDAFLFCEALASNGYIVVTGAYQSNSCSDFTIGWNLDISFNEIDFLVNYVQKNIPGADMTKLFGAGHSYGAQAILSYASIAATPFIGFLIFDSTADYDFTFNHPGFKKLKDRLYPKIPIMTKPLFVVARTTATFRLTDSLKNCDRYYLQEPNMEHEDFTSQGAVARLLEYDGSNDFLKLKQPYLNYVYQVRSGLTFMEVVMANKKLVLTPAKDSSNQMIFETSPAGSSRYTP